MKWCIAEARFKLIGASLALIRERVHAWTRFPSARNSCRTAVAGGRDFGGGYGPQRVP
jgi:hypothetical protein